MQYSLIKFLSIVLLALFIAACGTNKKSGGYYQDDGPGKRRVDLESIPNATPKYETVSAAAARPYTINGKRYVPLTSAEGFVEEGKASWYGKKYHGRKTSIGETYDMYKMTAAHKTLPLPSYVRVTNVVNQRSIIVRVNDRGPFIGNRIIDLSYVAAQKLGVVSAGTSNVIVESVSPSSLAIKNQNGSQPRSAIQSSGVASAQGEIPPSSTAPNFRYTLPETQSQSGAVVAASSQGGQNSRQVVRQNSQNRPQLVPSYNASSQQKNQQQPVTGEPQYRAQPANSQANTYNAAASGASRWIQVGAFSVRENAQKLVSRLNSSGYSNTQVRQQNNLFKVLVGPLSEQAVLSTQRTLRTNGYPAILVSP